MARLVLFRARGPIMVGEPPVAICGCGLSRKWPYCTGAHIHTVDEEEDKVYVYDSSGVDKVAVTRVKTTRDEMSPLRVYSPT